MGCEIYVFIEQRDKDTNTWKRLSLYRKNKDDSFDNADLKKSKHKHDYVNCVVVSDGKEHLVSRCAICGRLSDFKHDDALSKMFPDLNQSYLPFFVYFNRFENNEPVKEWCLDNYQVFHVDDFDQFKDKYI